MVIGRLRPAARLWSACKLCGSTSTSRLIISLGVKDKMTNVLERTPDY